MKKTVINAAIALAISTIPFGAGAAHILNKFAYDGMWPGTIEGHMKRTDVALEAVANQSKANTDAIDNNTAAITANKQAADTAIKANSDKIADNTAAITANKQAADAAIKANSDKIADNSAAITANKQAADAAIKANSDKIADNSAAITANKQAADTAIKANSDNIATNAGNIEKNSAAIASQAQAFRDYQSQVTQGFDAVNGRIDNLSKEMKRGFAAQAALNGLFQPYNVGKFNVTAAIGGYESEQGVAIGTGYRVNENFAVKAGVATNLSNFKGVTYNLGANLEW